MGTTGVDVLVVDDNKGYAESLVDALKYRFRISATYTTEAEEALEMVKNQSFKIVILDQKMPTKGTELRPQIRKLDQYVRIVLISAEKPDEDLFNSEITKFDATLSKSISDFDNVLYRKILELFQEYQRVLPRNNVQPFWEKGFFKKVSYSLIGYEIIQDNLVIEDRYYETMCAYKGRKETEKVSVDIEKQDEFKNSLKVDAGMTAEVGVELNISELISGKGTKSLYTAISQNFEQNYTKKIEKYLEKTHEMQPIDENSHVAKRSYGFYKVYCKTRIFIRVHCSCCNQTSVFPIIVNIPVPKLQEVMIEYRDDDTTKKVYMEIKKCGDYAIRSSHFL